MRIYKLDKSIGPLKESLSPSRDSFKVIAWDLLDSERGYRSARDLLFSNSIEFYCGDALNFFALSASELVRNAFDTKNKYGPVGHDNFTETVKHLILDWATINHGQKDTPTIDVSEQFKLLEIPNLCREIFVGINQPLEIRDQSQTDHYVRSPNQPLRTRGYHASTGYVAEIKLDSFDGEYLVNQGEVLRWWMHGAFLRAAKHCSLMHIIRPGDHHVTGRDYIRNGLELLNIDPDDAPDRYCLAYSEIYLPKSPDKLLSLCEDYTRWRIGDRTLANAILMRVYATGSGLIPHSTRFERFSKDIPHDFHPMRDALFNNHNEIFDLHWCLP